MLAMVLAIRDSSLQRCNGYSPSECDNTVIVLFRDAGNGYSPSECDNTVIVLFRDAGNGYSPSECDNTVIVLFTEMLAMVIRHLNVITL